MKKMRNDQDEQEQLFASTAYSGKEGTAEEEDEFEQQVKEMLVNGRLCAWVSVKGWKILLIRILPTKQIYIGPTIAGTPLSERINRIFLTASKILKQEVCLKTKNHSPNLSDSTSNLYC
jgi:hypothetical protein